MYVTQSEVLILQHVAFKEAETCNIKALANGFIFDPLGFRVDIIMVK